MSIESKIDEIATLLQMIKHYDLLIAANSFEESTIEDMQGNAKATCDDIKDDVTEIKTLIDSWS